jgi:phosphate transport system substrate-binding protein
MKIFLKVVLVLAVMLSFTHVAAAQALNGAGATFPYPLYSAWAFEYSKETGIKLNYQSIGSGGGVRQIINRTVDFGASDDALEPKEIEQNKFFQWPQVIGGEVLAINMPGIKSGEMVLDADSVSKIFLGDIKYWDDAKIKGLNPSLKLPHSEITVVHRSDGSGTTAVFTHYLAEASPAWKSRVGEGKSVSWPVGIGGKGNEGVANYTGRTANSIGYVEFAYAIQNNLTYTLLKNPAGKVVKPTLGTFAEAAAAGDYNPQKDFYTWVTNAKSPNAWPIVAATNILVAREKVEQNKRVVKFFDWAFSKKADDIATGLGLIRN